MSCPAVMTITPDQIRALQQHHFPDGVPHDTVVTSIVTMDQPVVVCRRCGLWMAGASETCHAWRPDLRIEDAMMLFERFPTDSMLHKTPWHEGDEENPGPYFEKYEVEFGNNPSDLPLCDTPAMAITLAALEALEVKDAHQH